MSDVRATYNGSGEETSLALPFPWHATALQSLMQGGLGHHAWLLVGAPGAGTGELAMSFAAALLCHAPEAGHACGKCESCRWWQAGLHPDLRVLSPDEQGEDDEVQKRKEIKIGAVRALGEWAPGSPHGKLKVVVVSPANTLNTEAANALLKLLEEPPPTVRFILTTNDRKRIPATVLSRCVSFPVPLPDAANATAWLKNEAIPAAQIGLLLAQSGGLPLAAKALADEKMQTQRRLFLDALSKPRELSALTWGDAIERIGKAEKRDALTAYLDWLIAWTHDLATVCAQGAPRYNPDFTPSIENLAKTLHAVGCFRYYAILIKQKRLVQHPLNARLVLEDVLIGYKNFVVG
jgi:DNA polymerase III subunit delta'